MPLENRQPIESEGNDSKKQNLFTEQQEWLIDLIMYDGNFTSFLCKIEPNQLNNLLHSPSVQSAAEQRLVNCLYMDDIDEVQAIIATFPDILHSTEVLSTAEQRLIDCLYMDDMDIDIIQAIIATFSLSDDFLHSQKVLHVAEMCLRDYLLNGEIDKARTIISVFSLSLSGIQQSLRSQHKEFLTLVWDKEIGFDLSKSEKDKIYQQEKVQLQHNLDPEVKSNFEWLETNLGKEKTQQIFQSKLEFWTNTHDTLLFIEKLKGLTQADTDLIKNIVLLPLLSSSADLPEFNNLIGSFDMHIWMSKHNGASVPFVSWAQFEREVQMQIHNIVIPANASDNFREAINTLITAPGVNVKFIRLLIDMYQRNTVSNTQNNIINHNAEDQNNYDDEYDNDNYDDDDNNNDDQAFANRLVKIIEGEDRIDERQLIKPWREIIPMDPLHNLVLTAVGIHGLNSHTVKLVQAWQQEDMKSLLNFLAQINEEIKQNIEAEYQQKINEEKDQNKKDKLSAEKQKTLRTHLLLRYGGSNTPEGINVENKSNYIFIFNDARQAKIREYLKSSLSKDPELKNSIINILHTFTTRGEELFNCVDLNSFAHILPLADQFNKTIQQIETELSSTLTDKKELRRALMAKITPADILAVFQDRELDLAELLLYFGLNNKSRQSQSKDIKNTLDKILKQKKYQARTKDPFLAYVKGELTVESDDENSIRDILKNYGYADIGRKLVVQIAKKSDPEGWVCGDYTDCCMPFTSNKNREYLLREDLAYFLVSIQNQDESEQIIAQSVLVLAQDKDHNPEIAIDNIEIANKAVKYRPVIAEAYKNLKKELTKRYQNQKFKIVIGTSYNDDGGTITGACELNNVDAAPTMGDMHYSDWAHHSSNYVYYDSEKKADNREKYFGLQIDLFAKSKVRSFIKDNEELTQIKTLLEKIGQGEDDGDDGLIFPDNYSVVIEQQQEILGYIIGADYIKQEGENDLLILEKMRLKEDLPINKKQELLQQYLISKNPQANDNIDGMHIKSDFLVSNPFAIDVIESFFSNCTIQKNNDSTLTVIFEK